MIVHRLNWGYTNSFGSPIPLTAKGEHNVLHFWAFTCYKAVKLLSSHSLILLSCMFVHQWKKIRYPTHQLVSVLNSPGQSLRYSREIKRIRIISTYENKVFLLFWKEGIIPLKIDHINSVTNLFGRLKLWKRFKPLVEFRVWLF